MNNLPYYTHFLPFHALPGGQVEELLVVGCDPLELLVLLKPSVLTDISHIILLVKYKTRAKITACTAATVYLDPFGGKRKNIEGDNRKNRIAE